MQHKNTSTKRRTAATPLRRRRASRGGLPPDPRLDGSGEAGIGRGPSTVDWTALVPRLIHETKVWIIETMSRLDRPISAREMKTISGGRKGIPAFDYHLRSLAKANCIQVVLTRRGARERLYFFTDAAMPRRSLPGSGAIGV